jgi:hypothetical protein
MNFKHRVAFLVFVDLDPIPGEFHTKESAQNSLRNILHDRIPQYNPLVSLAPATLSTSIEDAQRIPRADLTFFNRRDVKRTYNRITDIIDEDGYASVLDLYGMTGRQVPTHFRRPHYWGWDVIPPFGFEKVDDGYLLILPQIKHLTVSSEPTNATITEGTKN